jgi:hypothetical protein
MKIYKEIVYQVAGNKLVKVSEDSFEYSGEVTECKSSGSDIIEDIAETTTEVDLDPRTSDTSNVLGDGTLGQNLNNIDLNPATSSINALDQPNLAQFGTGQGGTLGDFTGGAAYYGGKVNQEIGGVFNYIGEKMQELSDFIHNPADAAAVTVDPDESAYSGLTANKKAAELAANKAKNQARSSLRINQ